MACRAMAPSLERALAEPSRRTRLRPTRRDFLTGVLGGAVGAGLAHWISKQGSDDVRRYLAAHPAFLADNPDLVAASAAVVETRAVKSEAGNRKALIDRMHGALLQPLAAPCIGPLNGRLGAIEITDYLCAPCRGSSTAMSQALAAHRGTNAIVLLVPISGAFSEYAASFAAAAYFAQPAAFDRFHGALMDGPMPDQTGLERLASENGYEVEALVRAADTPKVRSYLALSRRFAEDLGLTGVPAFLNAGGAMHLGGITPRQAIDLVG